MLKTLPMIVDHSVQQQKHHTIVNLTQKTNTLKLKPANAHLLKAFSSGQKLSYISEILSTLSKFIILLQQLQM